MVTHLLLFVKGARGEICKFSPNPLPCRKKTQRKLLTNRIGAYIILEHLRECWNGRQARLRCVWLRRVGSSPISRTKKKATRQGSLLFGMWGGTRKAVKKTCRWHVFRPWESPSKYRRIRHGCGWILTEPLDLPFDPCYILISGILRSSSQPIGGWLI